MKDLVSNRRASILAVATSLSVLWSLFVVPGGQPAVEPLHFDKPKIVGVGLGLAFGKAMAEAEPDVTIGLIPCAVGGRHPSCGASPRHRIHTGRRIRARTGLRMRSRRW